MIEGAMAEPVPSSEALYVWLPDVVTGALTTAFPPTSSEASGVVEPTAPKKVASFDRDKPKPPLTLLPKTVEFATIRVLLTRMTGCVPKFTGPAEERSGVVRLPPFKVTVPLPGPKVIVFEVVAMAGN